MSSPPSPTFGGSWRCTRTPRKQSKCSSICATSSFVLVSRRQSGPRLRRRSGLGNARRWRKLGVQLTKKGKAKKASGDLAVDSSAQESRLLHLVLALFRERERDFAYVGVEVINKVEAVWTSRSFPKMKDFLLSEYGRQHFSWWDILDVVAVHFLGAAILNERRAKSSEEKPVKITCAEQQLDSSWITVEESFWLPRMAALSHLLFKEKDYGASGHARLFKYCSVLVRRSMEVKQSATGNLLKHIQGTVAMKKRQSLPSEDSGSNESSQRQRDEICFLDKAVGWALRQYSKLGEEAGLAVRNFLAEKGLVISHLTKTEALKILEKKKK
mmetsp:Transcript_78791/g.222780  ORF Transcript_78791/g.222780 Transcript_78791/m.222780 type:complete len:328 (-) Transcript_78791:65-1048(-)